MKKLLLAATLLAASSQINAATVLGENLLKNGSFEALHVGHNNYKYYDRDTRGLGWWTDGLEVRNNFAGSAKDGKQFAELDSNNKSIAQMLQTVAGQQYQLEFYYSPRVWRPSNENTLAVSWNGGYLKGSVKKITANLNEHDWRKASFTVTGTGGVDKLMFYAFTGAERGMGISLDDISLRAITAMPMPPVSEVPVPAAAFLFAPALIGFMGLRRKAKQA